MLMADASERAGDAHDDGLAAAISFVGDLWVAGPSGVGALPNGMRP